MFRFVQLVVSALLRLVLSFRYTVKRIDWPDAKGVKRPVLILPNHPALIDPVLLLALLHDSYHPRTVLYEGNFSGLIRTLLFKLLQAVSIPDLRRPSREAYERAEQAVAEVIAGLRRGENFILWPSGHAQRDGVERLGSARALTDILNAVPEATVLMVRTRGLWGSMFSYARKARLPNLPGCILNGGLLLLANLLFFMPRRHVKITMKELNRADLTSLERDRINRDFETWYNTEGPEPPTHVPYHFLFGARDYQFPRLQSVHIQIDPSEITQDTRIGIAEILTNQLHRPVGIEELKLDTKLEDLGLDSLQRMEVAVGIEHRFGRTIDASPLTVGELMAMAQGCRETEATVAPAAWFKPPTNVKPLCVLAESIPAAFVERALSTPGDIAAADDLSGVVTYERLLVGALVMARRFERLTGKNVGLMLPASVASDIMLFALYLANKLPILLNWTTGPANLAHAVKLTEVTHVVTSRQLRDRLNISIDGITFIDVEDLRREVGLFESLCTLLKTRMFPSRVRQSVPRVDPNSTSVILFTSGSEKAPKGVPLTHHNIIANLRMLPSVLELTTKDSVLGFLPMFHSFGFTMTGLLPLLGGIRVVHHPDPTDTANLSRKISSYAPTVLVGMPSLIGHLIERSRPGELDSIRWIAVGAEKCPHSLFEATGRLMPKATMLEGYGVTECSPLISANRTAQNRPGTIGIPLPGLQIRVVDVATDTEVPIGTMGMLQVSGPTVFPGYLGDETSPFVERNGTQWYVTGDLVSVDSDGFIHFEGRLKRFVKAGGEMISLPALEDPFVSKYPPDDDGPRVAVEGIEFDSGRRIVLFTTLPIELAEANALLAHEGFRGVMRLDAVHHLDKIPVLGTGKIDYRQLRSLIK
ncbi:AMP-binding protein [Schlesneria paludicola]|uniref:AMP-binding protein n=1 Tax=Schlesneria paludicola TaxID=360056 RepID=UPI00029A36DD|nr:AMP-binding protein [Schlesneria paludicola]